MNLPDCLRCHPMVCVLPRRFPFQNSARSKQRPFRTAPAQNSARSEQRPLRTATVVGNESRPRARPANTLGFPDKKRRTKIALHEQPDGAFPRVAPTPIRSPQRLHMEYCAWNTASGILHMEYCTWNHVQQTRKAKALNPKPSIKKDLLSKRLPAP